MHSLKLLILLNLFFAGRHTTVIPKDAIKGDFNGDGKPEYVWVIKPKLDKTGYGCIGKCEAQIVCSDAAIKPVSVGHSIGGTLTNLGDLNDDGKDDLGILPDWFIGCWAAYHVYGLANNQWHEMVPSFSMHCIQWDEKGNPIEKVPGKKGYVKIRYSKSEKEKIVVKTKIVKLI